MSKKYSIFKTGLTVLLAALMVGAVVNATTTVGDNVSVGGTLGVTGATTLTGAATLSSTLAVTGASTLTGALAANGGIAVDTSAFTVADTSGNTAIAGTLGVTGATTLTGATTVTGVLYANGGIDRLTAGALAIGASTSTSVAIGGAVTTGSIVIGAAQTTGLLTLGKITEEAIQIGGYDGGGTTLYSIILAPKASAVTSSITQHHLVQITDPLGGSLFGDVGAVTYGLAANFDRSDATTGDIGGTDTGFDMRVSNDATNDSTYDLQGAYIKAKNEGTVDVLKGLFVEALNDQTGGIATTVIGVDIGIDSDGTETTATGLNIRNSGVSAFNDISLQNGATIVNGSANVLTVTEPTITLAGATAINLNGPVSISSAVTFGSAATAGILHGAGSAGQDNAVSLGTSAGKAMSYYIKTTSATASHALEGMYVTTYHGVNGTSVAPMGEAGRFRAFLVGDASAGTIAGSHDTVEISSGGTNTGLTLGTRGNVMFPNEVMGAAGTYAGVQAELNTGGAATDVSGTTASILRLIIDGTAPTSAAQFTIPVISVVVPSNLVGNNLIIDDSVAGTLGTVTAKMRITVNGTTYWIPLTNAGD